MTTKSKTKQLKCKVCEYEWVPRVKKPRKCPNERCQSFHWEKGLK